MYIRAHIYIYIYVYACICADTHTYICNVVSMYTGISLYAYMYIFMYMSMYLHMPYRHACERLWTRAQVLKAPQGPIEPETVLKPWVVPLPAAPNRPLRYSKGFGTLVEIIISAPYSDYKKTKLLLQLLIRIISTIN